MTLTKQVETLTVLGSITGNGNATFVLASARASATLSVAVSTADDTAAKVALEIRTAIALNATICDVYQVSGTGADIVLTDRQYHANDTTLVFTLDNGTCTGLTKATSANTTAGVGLNLNAYITLAELKSELAITDTTDDDALVDCINAVGHEIDETCHRQFYQTSETRYFTPSHTDQCLVSDLLTVSQLATDTDYDRNYVTTWATTDYDLYPYNSNEPYYRIDIAPLGDNTFDQGSPKFVKVVGTWGFTSVPPSVKQACLLWSMRTYLRHKTVLGVSGTNAFGAMQVKVPPPDPDVAQFLDKHILNITGDI